MIIEELKLSNWLSYPNKWVINNERKTPTLHFDQEQVWLIYGKNGAGKSGIMEAIIFALFGEFARSLGEGAINKSAAVRTGETSSHVELVFQIRGERYRVQRVLYSSGRASGATLYKWDANSNNWVIQQSNVTSVNKEISLLLKMERELFRSTVVLEQGQTGRFMEFSPGEQVEFVIKLLGLDIYTRYHQKANRLANERKRDARAKEAQLKQLEGVTKESVEQVESQAGKAGEALEAVSQELARLRELLKQAQAVDKLRTEIAEKEQQLLEFEAKLEQRDEIRRAARYVQEWEPLRLRLEATHQAVLRVRNAEGDVQRYEKELANKQTSLGTLGKTIGELKSTHEQAEIALSDVRQELETLRAQLKGAEEGYALIRAELNYDMREEQILRDQRERETKLEAMPKVKADYALRGELDTVVPELRVIVQQLEGVAKELALCQEGVEQLSKEEKELGEKREQLDQLRSERDESEEQWNTTKRNIQEVKTQLDADGKLLERREAAHGKSSCPTCGTELKGAELDRFHQELELLRESVRTGRAELTEAEKEEQRLKGVFEQLNSEYRQAEQDFFDRQGKLKGRRQNLQLREETANRQKAAAESRWQQLQHRIDLSATFIKGPTPVCLKEADNKLQSLADVGITYLTLTRMETNFENAQDELKRIEGQRKHSANTFTANDLEESRHEVEKLGQRIEQAEESSTDATNLEREANRQLTRAEAQREQLAKRIQEIEKDELPSARQTWTQQKQELNKARDGFFSQLSVIDWPAEMIGKLKGAIDNEGHIKVVDDWINKQKPLARMLQDLKKAEQEIHNLRGQKELLEAQLSSDDFTQEARDADVEIVQNDIEKKTAGERLQRKEYVRLQQVAWQAQRDLEDKQKAQAEHARLLQEEQDFRKLASLLEPPGTRSPAGPLLQQIMYSALKEVADSASDILESWNQAMHVTVPDDVLEFRVTDLTVARQERHYKLFSGGEKFMVALAMALAIGEVASGTGHTDCLFIDEGFGLLDAENRDVVAQEIVNKLVGSGRRKQVIVITHMEDLHSSFPACYHLVHDGQGTQLASGQDYASA